MLGAHEVGDPELVGHGGAGEGATVDAVRCGVLRHDEVGLGRRSVLEVAGELLIFHGEPADALLPGGDGGTGGLAGLFFLRFAFGFGGLLVFHPLQFPLGLFRGSTGFRGGFLGSGDPLLGGQQLRFRLCFFQSGGFLVFGPLVDLAQRFRDKVRYGVFLGNVFRRRGRETVHARKVPEAESGVLRMVSGEHGLLVLFSGPVRDGGRSRYGSGNGADDGTELQKSTSTHGESPLHVTGFPVRMLPIILSCLEILYNVSLKINKERFIAPKKTKPEAPDGPSGLIVQMW